jgi:hypothetical protein
MLNSLVGSDSGAGSAAGGSIIIGDAMPALPALGSDDSGDNGSKSVSVEGTALSELISEVFPDLEMGLRLSYLTPSATADAMPDFQSFDANSSDANLTELIAMERPIINGQNIGDRLTPGSLINQYSSFFLYNVGSDTTIDMHAALNSQELADALAEGGSAQGFSRFVDALYEEKKVQLCKDLAQNSLVSELFGPGGGRPLIDVVRILQYLYISGELKNYYSKLRLIFSTIQKQFWSWPCRPLLRVKIMRPQVIVMFRPSNLLLWRAP